jgi:uroporphyrinogen-III synthase
VTLLEARPLARRLLVTRPAEAAARDVAALLALGVPADALPLIHIEPLGERQALRRAWAELPQYRLVMFVSRTAVQHFFAFRPEGPGAALAPAQATGAAPPGNTTAAEPVAESDCVAAPGWPQHVLAAAPGPGTLQALSDAGVPPAACVAPAIDAPAHDSEALWERLRGEDWRGQRALIVAGEGGRDWFELTLASAGAQVDRLSVYRRGLPLLDDAQRSWLASARDCPGHWIWQFSSGEAIDHLGQLAPGADWSRSQALAPHPRIEAAARAAGFGSVHAVGVEARAIAAWWRSTAPVTP